MKLGNVGVYLNRIQKRIPADVQADILEEFELRLKELIDDALLDPLEDKIQEEPDWYDGALMAAIRGLRHALDIPDNIGGDTN